MTKVKEHANIRRLWPSPPKTRMTRRPNEVGTRVPLTVARRAPLTADRSNIPAIKSPAMNHPARAG